MPRAGDVLREARHRAGRARGQGGARAHQRHAVHGVARDARAARGRAPLRGRRRRRRDEPRGAQGLEPPLRRAPPRGASAPGPGPVARNLRALLADSEIAESHKDCGKVQDAYSLRCMPQVHGATRDALAWVRAVLEREVNSVTDNPSVFLDRGEADIISGGNFHGQPLALALDLAAIASAGKQPKRVLRTPEQRRESEGQSHRRYSGNRPDSSIEARSRGRAGTPASLPSRVASARPFRRRPARPWSRNAAAPRPGSRVRSGRARRRV